MQYPIPVNEHERLQELYNLQILNTPAEKDFDDIVRLASQACNMPISLISLMDADRQWFKAKHNYNVNSQTPREVAFCNYTIAQDQIFEVTDCDKDERFQDFPLVKEDPNIRYYAGVPLVSANGYNVGTLCVLDTVPRQLTEEQILTLEVLSRHAMSLMELRTKNKQLTHMAETQNKIISIIGHDIRNPLSSFRVMLNMQQDPDTAFDEEETAEMNGLLVKQLDGTIDLLNNLVQWGKLQMKIKENKTESVDMEAIATRSFRSIEVAASLKGNILHKQVAQNTYISGDETAIEFILRNLLTNANKFTENGRITVACTMDDNRPHISVTDTGIGMSEKQINQVLHETGSFISTGTQNERGSGIGLSLVREFLAKQNSCLSINSTPGEGTTVSFRL